MKLIRIKFQNNSELPRKKSPLLFFSSGSDEMMALENLYPNIIFSIILNI